MDWADLTATTGQFSWAPVGQLLTRGTGTFHGRRQDASCGCPRPDLKCRYVDVEANVEYERAQDVCGGPC